MICKQWFRLWIWIYKPLAIVLFGLVTLRCPQAQSCKVGKNKPENCFHNFLLHQLLFCINHAKNALILNTGTSKMGNKNCKTNETSKNWSTVTLPFSELKWFRSKLSRTYNFFQVWSSLIWSYRLSLKMHLKLFEKKNWKLLPWTLPPLLLIANVKRNEKLQKRKKS